MEIDTMDTVKWPRLCGWLCTPFACPIAEENYHRANTSSNATVTLDITGKEIEKNWLFNQLLESQLKDIFFLKLGCLTAK